MSNHDDGTTEPARDAKRPEAQPIKKLEDDDVLKSTEALEEEDSTLNEGWPQKVLKSSRPKPVPPKPPEPLAKESSADDTGDSSCV